MSVARSVLLMMALSSPVFAQSPPASPALDFEFFKTRVQPIFLAERPGHARCIACHGRARPCGCSRSRAGRHGLDRRGVAEELRYRPADGRAGQREEPAADASARGKCRRRLLSQRRQALESQDDPEWQTIKSWVMGADARASGTASARNHPDEQRRR